jgi:hypothetical protein
MMNDTSVNRHEDLIRLLGTERRANPCASSGAGSPRRC